MGYVGVVGVKSTKAGFRAIEYELNVKAYLALMLDSIEPDDLLDRIHADAALEMLAAMTTLCWPSALGQRGKYCPTN